jgi:hypothetical protein
MYDDTLDDVQKAMKDDAVGYAIYQSFNAIDELILLANRDETKAQVCAERIALGQLLNRCQLLVSFALEQKPGLMVVSNGG